MLNIHNIELFYLRNNNLLNAINTLNYENKILKSKIIKSKNILRINNKRAIKTKPKSEDCIFFCPVDGCNKSYQKNFILITHIRIKHQNLYNIPKLKNGRRNNDSNKKIELNDFKI